MLSVDASHEIRSAGAVRRERVEHGIDDLTGSVFSRKLGDRVVTVA